MKIKNNKIFNKDVIESEIIENEQLDFDFILGKYHVEEIVNKSKNEARSKIDVFEAVIIEFIKRYLENYYKQNWWEYGIPGDIKNEAERRLNIEKVEEPHRTYQKYEFLTLTDLMHIICYKNNWRNIFSQIFHKKHQIRTYFENIRNIRNRISHYRDKFFEVDLKRLEVYLEDIYKYLK